MNQERQQQSEPIAIIGLACRIPGGANDPESLWNLMRDRVDAVQEIPPSRWDIDAYYDPELPPETMNTKWAGLLDQVDQFDPAFFGISTGEAAWMDPQQRLVLEVAWEALENAGLAADRLRGSATGVFIGACFFDYFHMIKGGPGRAAAGLVMAVLAHRVSHVMDFRGPSFAVDSACSSSLLTAHLACNSLRSRECDVALTGGVNVILRPEITVAFSQAGMMSPEGRCKCFDAAADGYVRGEGCGILVLKRLADADRDHDRVHAVIRGSAVNQDGYTRSITAPKGEAQVSLLQSALHNVGLDPDQIGYIEAHSTGTPLGDATELRALQEVFAKNRVPDNPLLVGSVKSNVGHLESAAGSLSMIKTVLCLQKKMIPPVVHFRQLTPDFEPENFPVHIPSDLVPWEPGEGPRIAGISAFNFAGGNVHLILEEAPDGEAPAMPAPEQREHLLVLSAKTEKALMDLARLYLEYFSGNPAGNFADVCYTASFGRSHFKHRMTVRASDFPEGRQGLSDFIAGKENPRISVGSVQKVEPGDSDRLSAVSPETPREEISAAYIDGIEIPWNLVYEPARHRRVELPTYPFQRKVCWLSPNEITGPVHSDS